MNVWITKYALTKGILTGEARFCRGSMIEVPSIRRRYAFFHGEGRDWHRTEEAAIARASQMRDATIESLQRRIVRLQKLTFTRPKKRTRSQPQ